MSHADAMVPQPLRHDPPGSLIAGAAGAGLAKACVFHHAARLRFHCDRCQLTKILWRITPRHIGAIVTQHVRHIFARSALVYATI